MDKQTIFHRSIRLTGRVQGVGFRYTARSMAFFHGVKGFVRNLSDGDVYIEAEGTEAQLEEYIRWCRQGPPRARIEFMDVYEGEVVGFGEFVVRH